MPDNSHVYESMFLISQAEAADLNGIIAHVEEILRRGDAEILAMRKWDERRLAYEIDKQRRGLYILCYFRAPASSIAHIERDCNLSERIMRTMLLRADHLTEEEVASQEDRTGLATEAKLRAARATERVARETEPEEAGEPAAAE
ncbi:MAG TPA: 30S ribosomal protein S6 [Phycisphaerales bacterium]|nr:30S ribosomal protein S6 [Phycisphaerales bacterium]